MFSMKSSHLVCRADETVRPGAGNFAHCAELVGLLDIILTQNEGLDVVPENGRSAVPSRRSRVCLLTDAPWFPHPSSSSREVGPPEGPGHHAPGTRCRIRCPRHPVDGQGNGLWNRAARRFGLSHRHIHRFHGQGGVHSSRASFVPARPGVPSRSTKRIDGKVPPPLSATWTHEPLFRRDAGCSFGRDLEFALAVYLFW